MGLIGLVVVMLVQVFLFPGSGVAQPRHRRPGRGHLHGPHGVGRAAHQERPGRRASTAESASVMGALALYLDFVNLFLFLLRIFGSSR